MVYPDNTAIAYFASGCFWGTQYHFDKHPGVIETYVGFMGGKKENPTYEEVKTGETGHVETVMVVYDPTQTSYRLLSKLFYETHDFTQIGGQGSDIGTQYRSVAFYDNDHQQMVAEEVMEVLTNMGYPVATSIEPASVFWIAENYHQKYYDKSGGTPYCHIYRKIF
ncbi:methionine-S-sulfoxide reductase [Parabacteroides sp. PFB2-12]|uniref:peptide-methionine (S)-S-oxide reductase MsrA n=1 Tax=unclassified Parabacteroides TaxID=2649774 RepID=UPI00247609B0|nr:MULTISPECIES: peptide-methionine (S)-S-oxide reductase MsrA [unclassified Parabacteroides]MDH6343430.1 methionine-S-sulfoxide reductase [Parabacteroides sp. PM6-13]MDH6391978.1 methionine-S-sulfoxide reductase [Parabacteroides sp. PFB2-12]